MDEPLASVAGNAIEVHNAVSYLKGDRRDRRLHEVTLALGAELLVLSGLAPSPEAASQRLEASLDTGEAAERFQRMVARLGGPSKLIDKPHHHLPRAPIARAVHGPKGLIVSIDTRALGLAVVELGGGRRRPGDAIHHAVGLADLAGKGDETGKERPLAVVHARDEESFARAAAILKEAYITGEIPAPRAAVHERIGPQAR
jgi:thymidine phosphorylase